MAVTIATGNGFLSATAYGNVSKQFVNNITSGGSLLVAFVSVNTASPVTLSCSDDVNGSWTALSSAANSGLVTQLQIFYKYNSASGGKPTVSITGLAAQQSALTIAEFIGVQSSSDPIDGSNSNSVNGGSGNPTSGSFTTTANGLVVGYAEMYPAATPTAGTGYTIGNLINHSSGYPGGTEYKLAATAGSNAAVFGNASQSYWVGIGAAFKEAGGGNITQNQTITGTSRITATTTKTETGKARIQVTTTKTETGTSRISIVTTKTETGTARITATTTKTETGISRIQKVVNQTITGVANIAASTITTTKTITGTGRVQKTVTATETGTGRIQKVVNATESGTARISVTTTKTETGISRIQKVVNATITGVANIASSIITTTKTISGVSRVTASTTRTETGTGRIQKTVSQTVQGVSRIGLVTTKTETGKARVQTVVSQTETGKARITATSSQTVTGKARIAGSGLVTVPLNQYSVELGSGVSKSLSPTGNMLEIEIVTTAPTSAPVNNKGVVFMVSGGVVTIYVWNGSSWIAK